VDRRLALANLLYKAGDYSETANQFRAVLKSNPDLTEPLNNLAWLLATCPDANVRNGSESVKYAEHACAITDYKDARTLGTLAAAYAEAGRFPDAIKTAERAEQLAMAANEPELAALNRQFLVNYRAGKAWHQSPRQ